MCRCSFSAQDDDDDDDDDVWLLMHEDEFGSEKFQRGMKSKAGGFELLITSCLSNNAGNIPMKTTEATHSFI